ncbi:MAG: potassium channel protein [Dorea sp.]|jgi:voltage-gated potassium channel|nr:potassium channel protein [Dorea sp.]
MPGKITKKRIFDIIQIGYYGDWQSKAFDMMVIVMILLNLFIAVFQTFEQSVPYRELMDSVEFITVVAFGVEYALRLWTAEYLYPEVERKRAVHKYVLSFSGIIELLAFLPYFLPVFFPAGAVAFRMFRVVRLLRLFQINAYYDALNVIGDVITGKRDQILSSVFIIMVLMVASSLVMYNLENPVQPEVFENAFSGFWWAVSTLLTVGYGDIYPVTIPGRIFGIIITFLGVGMVAIPTGILSAGFVEHYTRMKSMKEASEESDIRFVQLRVGKKHPWIDMKVKDLPLPPGLLIAAVKRQENVVVPRGSTQIRQGDFLVLGAEGYKQDIGIRLKELVLKDQSTWVGLRISELDISRKTMIVMIRREDKMMIPNGSTKLRSGDVLLLYTRKNIRDAIDVDV